MLKSYFASTTSEKGRIRIPKKLLTGHCLRVEDPAACTADQDGRHIIFSLKKFKFLLKFCVKILLCMHYFRKREGSGSGGSCGGTGHCLRVEDPAACTADQHTISEKGRIRIRPILQIRIPKKLLTGLCLRVEDPAACTADQEQQAHYFQS